MSKIPVQPILKSLGKAADETATEILKATDQAVAVRRAYHGSPHDFDKFSLQHIGTGEGAQAYGHGLYFSSSEDVAKWYRDKLSGPATDYNKLRKPFDEAYADFLARLREPSERITALEKELAGLPEPNVKSGQALLDDFLSGDFQTDPALDRASAIHEELNELREKAKVNQRSLAALDAFPIQSEADLADRLAGDAFPVEVSDLWEEASTSPGKLYTVEIPDESNMLDWDKPLSEQPEGVREALKAAEPEINEILNGLRLEDFMDPEFPSRGKELHDQLAFAMRDARSGQGSDQRAVSAKLREFGIPGITYKGGSSGERNFVVFDDELVSIKEKGFVDPRLLAPVGAGAAVGAAYANEPEPTLDDFHAEKTAAIARKDALDAMFAAADEAQPPAVREDAGPDELKVGAPVSGSVMGDIGEGIIEAPSQILGGVAEAANEVFSLIRDVGDWANENIVDLGHIVYSDEEGLEHLSTDEFRARFASEKDFDERSRDYAPETPEADSVTGGFVRGISQFVAGFVGAGKIKWLKDLRNAGTGARITSDAIRGAISDFAVFDPHEERLSNLIERFPALQNPVTEYLAADEDDPALLGRLKGAVEGLIPGVAIDGLVEAFTAGVRALRGVRQGKKLATEADRLIKTEADETAQAVATAAQQRERLTTLMGDPAAPVLQPKPLDVDARALQAAGDFVQEDVFVNWARIDSPDDVKRIIQEMANLGKEGIDQARRGVVGWQQTKLDAESLNAWDLLASRRVGQPLNNAETVAVRELWARSGSKLKELTDAVVSDPGEMNMIAFRKMLAVHNAIQEQVIAARTETARALNAWKIPAGDDVAFMGQMDQLHAILESGGASRTTMDIAERLKMLTDAGMAKEADQFVYGTPLMKSADAVAQMWYFSLLSGPKTHMRNAISNTAVLLNSALERKAASLIGQVKGVQNIPDGESAALMFGMMQGVRDAFRVSAKARQAMMTAARQRSTQPIADAAGEFGTAWRALATGESGIGIGKVEAPRLGALSSEKLGLDKSSPMGMIMDVIDTATTMPGRMLNMADEVFKSMNYRAEMNAQAFRRATQELSAGKITDVQDRIAELMSDPDTAMQLVARKSAEVNTFTNEPLDTGMWRAFKSWGNIPVIGKLTLPFRRTPYNIGTYTFSRTPLAPLVKQWRTDIAAGGAKADLAWAKFLTGNAILLTMADLAMNGDTTGEGPSHGAQRETERRQKIQPSSIRVNVGTDDEPEYRYFSYRGLEPMSTSIGISANIVDILSGTDWEDDNAETEQLVIAASMAIANQITSQQYMSGISAMFESLGDPVRYGESWWQRMAGSVVPAGVAEVTRAQDPYLRYVHDMTTAIMARTPGQSEKLPHKRDAWGRPITRESGLGTFYDAVSPIYSAKEDSQPIDLELSRLETWIGKPDKRTAFDGITVNMDRYPVEYDRWTALQGQEITSTIYGAPISGGGFVSSGENLMTELNMLVEGKHPNYPPAMYNMLSDGPDGGKAKLLRRIISEYRDAAKDHLLEESPKLRAEVETRKADQKGRFVFQ